MESDSEEISESAPRQGVADAWETVTTALVSPGCPLSEQSLSDSLDLLCSQGLGPLLGTWLLETLQMHLSSYVVPEFWSGLKQPENELEERDRVWILLTTFQTLLGRLEPFLGMWSGEAGDMAERGSWWS